MRMLEVIDCQADLPLLPQRHKACKYPWRTMAVGDSFFTTAKRVNTTDWFRSTGHKFTQRRVTENGIEGLRVWRIS